MRIFLGENSYKDSKRLIPNFNRINTIWVSLQILNLKKALASLEDFER